MFLSKSAFVYNIPAEIELLIAAPELLYEPYELEDMLFEFPTPAPALEEVRLFSTSN